MMITIGLDSSHGFDEPLGLLSDCHRRIERFMAAMLKVARQYGGRELDAEARDALERCLRYFQILPRHHNADEEESLFPRLRNEPAARDAMAVVDQLHKDHRTADVMHAEAESLAKQWLADGRLAEDSARRLTQLLEQLTEHYRQHIQLEDELVFPLAGRVLSPQQLLQVGREMAERRGVDPALPRGRCSHVKQPSSPQPSSQPGDDRAGESPVSTIELDRTISDLVTEKPSRSRVFEQLGIDYCCGGKRPLAEVCREKGLDEHTVVDKLIASDREPTDTPAWTQMTLAQLADHIEQTHHAHLRSELPRLQGLMARVIRAHGRNHPWVNEVAEVLERFSIEMLTHARKEEHVLFPAIRAIERGEDPALPASLAHVIGIMEREHENSGDELAKMRELSSGFVPPEHACPTFRALLDGLRQLEADTHEHVHKENAVLFPRALELETARR